MVMLLAVNEATGTETPSQTACVFAENPLPGNDTRGPNGGVPPKSRGGGTPRDGRVNPESGRTTNTALAEVPPPGGGLVTVIVLVEGCASSGGSSNSSK